MFWNPGTATICSSSGLDEIYFLDIYIVYEYRETRKHGVCFFFFEELFGEYLYGNVGVCKRMLDP